MIFTFLMTRDVVLCIHIMIKHLWDRGRVTRSRFRTLGAYKETLP